MIEKTALHDIAGGLCQNVSLFEWLLKGRGVGCLPKDAEKPTRGGVDEYRVMQFFQSSFNPCPSFLIRIQSISSKLLNFLFKGQCHGRLIKQF